MATLTALPSPKKHHSPKTTAPRKTFRHEAFHDESSSAPSSPNRRARQAQGGQREPPRSSKQASATYLQDKAPANSHDDQGDPHELSFPSSHMPRASMVDNLVMSLDQFSTASLGGAAYSSKSKGKPHDLGVDRRARGHTFSSSVSSDGDIRDVRNLPVLSSTTSNMPRRSSLKYQKDLQKLPSIFGEDEDPTRVRVYEAQRAENPLTRKTKKKTPAGVKSRSSSASSSVDLGHLAKFQGRLGPAGNRRSRSFDFGSSQRTYRHFDLSEPVEVAPTPVVFSGPEAQNSPVITSFPGVPLARKTSTKSSKSTHVRKSRAGTLGTTTIKPKGYEAPPALPMLKNPSQYAIESKPGPISPHEPSFAARPGFFRRVFGSSKNAQAHADAFSNAGSAAARPSQDRTFSNDLDTVNPATPPSKLQKSTRRISTNMSANKENHPIVSKKPSAFFRRRKKSISNAVPAPLPLTLDSHANNDTKQGGETSPVSSLRAFMDPYLVGNSAPPSGHTRNGSNQGFYTPPAIPLTSPDPRVDQPARPETQGQKGPQPGSRHTYATKPVSTLRIPHQDSFLADSSSADEQSRKDNHDSSPRSDSHADSKPRYPDGTLMSATGGLKSPQTSLASGLRPQIPDRSHSWNSEGDRDVASAVNGFYGSKTSRKRPTDIRIQEDSKILPASHVDRNDSKASGRASASDVSDYRSAPSTPIGVEPPDREVKNSPFVHVSHPSVSMGDNAGDKRKARKIFDNDDEELDQSVAGAWLGEAGTERERIRNCFMELFDFTHLNILASLRSLCDRIVLKGETQQVDRMLDAFARRWCACNSHHGFKSSDVVHTICYSILLLNTDLHLANIEQKMTRTQFIRNALPPIKRIAKDHDTGDSGRLPVSARSTTFPSDNLPGRASTELEAPPAVRVSKRPVDKLTREESTENEILPSTGGPLIEAAYTGTERGWENQVESVLKSFYSSISQEPLPLFGAQVDPTSPPTQSSNLLALGTNMLRRTPSTLSKTPSDITRGRHGSEGRSLGARWVTKARSRPRLPPAVVMGSSRTSLDEQSSAWSPSMSSTWSKNSIGKTLNSMSVDSFGTEATHADYQSSIGFANALSQAIIRDDQFDFGSDEGLKAAQLLDDESLELSGAPWAKEGILKHKCHLEGIDKKSKDRNWSDCFAVIEKGWMRLFSFTMTAKSLRNKARNQKAGGVVGGGNWQDNAEEVWKFLLHHTIASALPPPGYSKTRPYVWALSLPTGAVHLFSVGTPDIVKEFVSTANFWSARLSKEPMMGAVSNMEYGWSDAIINRALINNESRTNLTTHTTSPRPSTQMSMRTSIDHGLSVRPRLPGDRSHVNDWAPPQQSMFASKLAEIDQLKALQTYVHNVEDELQKHNELRGPMLLAFSSKHPNSTKAMSNWEKKSSYLLREIVKFRTYIDTLQNAQGTKERIYKMRREEEEARRAEDDSRALNGS